MLSLLFSIVPTAVVITALCFIGFSLAATVADTRLMFALSGSHFDVITPSSHLYTVL